MKRKRIEDDKSNKEEEIKIKPKSSISISQIQKNKIDNKPTDFVLQDEKDDDDVYLSDDYIYGSSSEEEEDEEEYEEKDENVKVLQTIEDKPEPRFLFSDEYDEDDSSEDESNINTVGNVPLRWYEEYEHIGYDKSGNKLIKKPRGDSLDDLIRKKDDPNYLRTIYDEYNDQEQQLSNKTIENIMRIKNGQFPIGFNEYRDNFQITEYDGRYPLKMNLPSKKSTLIVNLDEQKKVREIKRKIKYENFVPFYKREHVPKNEKVFAMWDDQGRTIGGQGKHPGILKAPNERIPLNDLSYNPPREYIDDENDENELKTIDKKMYKIPSNEKIIDDRLKRCLELYLCTREVVKRYKDQKPEDLFKNDLPNPKDLRPFPEIQSVVYEGHTDIVRTISVDPNGQWLISGDQYGSVRLWEVETGRCLRVWNFNGPIMWVEWNPNPELNLILVACENIVFIIQPPETGSKRVNDNTRNLFPSTMYQSDPPILELPEEEIEEEPEEVKADDQLSHDYKRRSRKGVKRLILQWIFNRNDGRERLERESGILVKLIHKYDVTQVSWHHKGDYFCSLCNPHIFIHQLSVRKSQKPFQKKDKKKGGKYQRIFFHPSKPWFYVCSQRKIKIYNLQKQKLRKKLTKHRCRYISDVDIHPNGEHLIIGGYDKRLEWFEVEISSRPCKSMKFHREAVRAVKFHRKYPLFASCSDDGNIHIFHQSLFDDWVKDPLIVPLKILKGHKKVKFLGVMDIKFHPFQPWIFSAGADRSIRLYTS